MDNQKGALSAKNKMSVSQINAWKLCGKRLAISSDMVDLVAHYLKFPPHTKQHQRLSTWKLCVLYLCSTLSLYILTGSGVDLLLFLIAASTLASMFMLLCVTVPFVLIMMCTIFAVAISISIVITVIALIIIGPAIALWYMLKITSQ